MKNHPLHLAMMDKEGSDGEFLWLISLADLMILLFVFFVVLFSFSIQKMQPSDLSRMSQVLTGEQPQSTPIDEVQQKLLKWVIDKNLLENVEVSRKEDALILEIKERLLFGSASFAMKPDSLELLKVIGQALAKIPSPYRIGIEGHTDDNPLGNKVLQDNWELSVRRAHNVLHSLQLEPELLKRAVIMGYGAMKPVAANRDEKGNSIAENQAKNRRVTIRIF